MLHSARKSPTSQGKPSSFSAASARHPGAPLLLPLLISRNRAHRPTSTSSRTSTCKSAWPDPVHQRLPCPHRPDRAPESTILHRSHEMQPLVRDTVVRQLGGVVRREECEFGGWKVRAYDLEEGQAIAAVKLERLSSSRTLR